MTGRYPARSGMCAERPRVLTPRSALGLPQDEITIAEALKTRDYATLCIGKWHLGRQPGYLPTDNGFDSYFGVPYSNDMRPAVLMRDTRVIEDPVDQDTLTRRYTEEAVRFIRQNKARPFLVYLPYTFPHVPLHASDRFRDTSLRGLYGDAVEEIDWSVGQIRQTLADLNLAENTLVFFTSDNGPWLIMKQHGGSAGLLYEGKGSTWEGGMREPAIACWPGKIKPGRINRHLTCTMDLFPTLLTLAGVPLPQDRIIDGVDLAPALFHNKPTSRQCFFYYRAFRLMAVRKGPWKAHLMTQPSYGPPSEKVTPHDPPLLYQLNVDPSEQYDVAADHPQVVADLLAEVEQHRETMNPPPSRLIQFIPPDQPISSQ